MLSLWIAVGFASAVASNADRDSLHCTFVSVGHGCSVVLELPGGQTVLYDAGSLGSPEAAARSIASVLWSRSITHLDAVVLSHADIDHYNALPELLERFTVGVVYVSPVMFDPVLPSGSQTALEHLRKRIGDTGVPIREIWAGDRLRTRSDVRLAEHHKA